MLHRPSFLEVLQNKTLLLERKAPGFAFPLLARAAQSTHLSLPLTNRHPYFLGHLRVHLNLDPLLAFPVLSHPSPLAQAHEFNRIEFLEEPDERVAELELTKVPAEADALL